MYTHDQVSDENVITELDARTGTERENLAAILSLVSEVDARKLYAPLGYESTFAFCTGRLGYEEGAAYKRIAVARAGRMHPRGAAAAAGCAGAPGAGAGADPTAAGGSG